MDFSFLFRDAWIEFVFQILFDIAINFVWVYFFYDFYSLALHIVGHIFFGIVLRLTRWTLMRFFLAYLKLTTQNSIGTLRYRNG